MKNKHRPTVPITDTLLPFLQDRNVYRFVHKADGTAYKNYQSVKSIFNRIRDAAGLPKDITLYSLRHAMATELHRRGVSSWEVKGLLGHRTEGVTEDYAAYGLDYLSEGRRAIDEYFTDLGAKFPDGAPWSNFNKRATRVPAIVTTDFNVQKLPKGIKGLMVGATGFEPATPIPPE